MVNISYCGHSYTHENGILFDTAAGNTGSDCYLLLYVDTPASFWVNGEMKAYPAKVVVLFSPRSRKYYRSDIPYTNDWIRFESDEDFISSLPQQNVPFLTRDPDYIHNLIQLICWEDTMKNPNSNYLTLQLFRVLFEKLTGDLTSDLTIPHYQELIDLRKRIKTSPCAPWTVSEMARSLHLSTTYLQTLYKKAFDISCMDDVIKSRIAYAQDKLIYSPRSIAEIAECCGYRNVEHFCRQFKAYTGITPNQFRKRLNNRGDLDDATFLYAKTE